MVRYPDTDGPGLLFLRVSRDLARGWKNKGIRPWRQLSDKAVSPVVQSRELADIRQVSAAIGEGMVSLQLA